MRPPPPSDAPPPPKEPLNYAEMGRSSWKNRAYVKIKCALCGKERETKIPHSTKWCGNTCNWRARREEGAYDRELTCSACSTRFIARPNRDRRFRETCSPDCRNVIVGRKNAKLTDADVAAIRKKGALGRSQRSIAADYNCSQNVISNILSGKSFKWVPGPPPKEPKAGEAAPAEPGHALPVSVVAQVP